MEYINIQNLQDLEDLDNLETVESLLKDINEASLNGLSNEKKGMVLKHIKKSFQYTPEAYINIRDNWELSIGTYRDQNESWLQITKNDEEYVKAWLKNLGFVIEPYYNDENELCKDVFYVRLGKDFNERYNKDEADEIIDVTYKWKKEIDDNVYQETLNDLYANVDYTSDVLIEKIDIMTEALNEMNNSLKKLIDMLSK